jgi:hypothetical protein
MMLAEKQQLAARCGQDANINKIRRTAGDMEQHREE